MASVGNSRWEKYRDTVGYSELKAIENTSTHFFLKTKISGDCLDQGYNLLLYI